MWKTIRIEGEMPDLSEMIPTGYGPQVYMTDTQDSPSVVRVIQEWSETTHNIERLPNGCGWSRVYRLVDIPGPANACRKAGVDPEGVFVTVFNSVVTYWVKTHVEADVLRLVWANTHNLTPMEAQDGVDSPHIGEDQREMYKAVMLTGWQN